MILKLGPRRRMRTLSRLTTTALGLSVVLSLLLAACGSPEPTPTAPATPTAVGAVDDREPWEIEWDELAAAAREEGELVVVGGSAAIVYRPMYKYFGDKFGIEVQSSGGSSRQIVDRILAERSIGRYTIDFFISGLGTSTQRLIPEVYVPRSIVGHISLIAGKSSSNRNLLGGPIDIGDGAV